MCIELSVRQHARLREGCAPIAALCRDIAVPRVPRDPLDEAGVLHDLTKTLACPISSAHSSSGSDARTGRDVIDPDRVVNRARHDLAPVG